MNKIFPSYKQVQENLSSGPIILQLLVIVIIVPIVEELCFRGITFSRLNRSLCAPLAIIIQGVIFGAAHMNLFQGIYAALLGIVLGFVYYKYKNLILVIILHIAFNFFDGIIYQIMNTKYVAQNKYIMFSISILLMFIFAVLIAKHQPEKIEIKYINMKGDKVMENQEILANEEATITAERVVRKALNDAEKKRDMSVCSLYVKCQHLNVKLLPQSLVMKIWMNSIRKYL